LNNLLLVENLNAAAEDLKKDVVIDRICGFILKTDMVYHFGQLDQLLELTDFHLQSIGFAASSHPSAGSLPVSNSFSSMIISPSAYIGSSPNMNASPWPAPLPQTHSLASSSVGVNGPIHTPKSAVELFKSLFGSASPAMNPHPGSSSSSLYSLTSAPIIKVYLKTSKSKEQLMQIVLHAAGTNNSNCRYQ
jgi:hypothetical protein